MTPLQALLKIAADEGVDRIFGNPGTTELPLIDGLHGEPIEYVLGLQEGSVVAMADGYARATRRTALVSLHVAAGLANGLIGLLNASRSRTPMVVLGGQQDRRHLIQDPMLSGDLVALAGGAVKRAVEVQHARDLPIVLRRAFAEARRPPAGPVYVSIPMDLLAEESEVELPDRSTLRGPGVADGVEQAAEILAAARRPVIIAGDDVGRSGAVADLVAVAEGLGARVLHQPMNDGVDFPGNHPLYAGMLPPRNAVIRETLAAHDVLLLVGCHAFMPHHYTPGSPIPHGLTVVQLDADPAEPGRNFAVELGLTGETAPTLRALADALKGRVDDARSRTEDLAARHRAERAAIDTEAISAYGDAPMDTLAAAHAIATGLPEDTIVVEEAITVGVRLRQVLRQDRPGSYVHTVGGGLGWGIGAAIGTKLGRPDRPVAAVLGDGCAMFGLQGLWTAAQRRLPVMFLVMNNGEYRTLKDTLDEYKSRSTEYGSYLGLDLHPPELDWRKAAEFFGIHAVRAESTSALRDLTSRAADLTGPLLIEAPIQGHG